MAHGRFDNPVIAALAGFWDFLGKQKLSDKLTDQDRIDGKTCLVTGANSGLGFALATDLAQRGGNVIMACRRQIPEAGEKVKKLSGSELVATRYVDLSKIETIHEFVDNLKRDHITLDIVILNAGVALPRARKTKSGLEEMFLVNYLANFILLSRLLHENIIPNQKYGKKTSESDWVPRVIFISSDSHQESSFIDYDEFGQYIDYGVSKGISYYSYYKLVLNTYATELSRRINKDHLDVIVNAICPGPVNTEIVKEAPWLLRKTLQIIFFLIFKSPKKAARAVVYMAISPDYAKGTNEYLHMFNPKKMDYKVYIPEEGRKLWEKSNEVWKLVDSQAKTLD